MTTESVNWSHVTETLDAFRRELGQLSERIAALEKTKETGSSTVSKSPCPPGSLLAASTAESLSDELVVVLGAAVAAFLGKRAPIRQIRLVGSVAWAQQGRVTIQASHAR